MLTIQEAGKQILTGNPGKFYVFVGEEYGIKNKYLEDLKTHYGDYKEVENISDLFNMFSHKSIIPLKPTLYIVRYDESFYSSLSDKTASKIEDMNIIGTIICIYQSKKHTSKFDKYLPRYTVSFDYVNKSFIKKYLKKDFSELDDAIIEFASSVRNDYNSAWFICNSLSTVTSSVNIKDLVHLFNIVDVTSETNLRVAFASRNYRYALQILETYPNLDQAYYVILNTLIELEKIMKNSYIQSDLREYVGNWNISDVYNMFMNTYEELQKVRSISSYKVYDSLVYLFSLSLHSPVLPVEVMK